MKNPKVRDAEEAVSVFEYNIIQTLKLPLTITPIPISFDAVINARKSVRRFNQLSLQQIGDVLWHTSKVRSISLQENGYLLSHRGVPSAGARHPIDIIIADPKLLSSGYLYYYNPIEHSLNKLANGTGSNVGFFAHINEIVDMKNATLMWFVAHFGRTSAKYQEAKSLIWRDAGALINGIQLVCTAMDIKSCPIGSLGEPYISEFFGADQSIFGSGGMLLG